MYCVQTEAEQLHLATLYRHSVLLGFQIWNPTIRSSSEVVWCLLVALEAYVPSSIWPGLEKPLHM